MAKTLSPAEEAEFELLRSFLEVMFKALPPASLPLGAQRTSMLDHLTLVEASRSVGCISRCAA